MEFLGELIARNRDGQQSDIWPYLNVHGPTPTPTPEPMPTSTPPPPACCEVYNLEGIPIERNAVGEYFIGDASCSPILEGPFLEYFFDMGDGTVRDWDRDPTFQYAYSQSYRWTIKVRTRTTTGIVSYGRCSIDIYP
jgi:hypothetical protein